MQIAEPRVAPEKRSHHSPGFVFSVMPTLDEVFMSDIVKICKRHGELTKEKIDIKNRCLACGREYSKEYRERYPEKTKAQNKKYQEMLREYKKHGFEYKPLRKNNRYYPERTSIQCKKHGLVEGKQLIIRENNYLRCRLCAYERNRSWEKRNPDKVKQNKRDNYLRYSARYAEESILRQKKITVEEYKNLIEKQNNLCAICNKSETKISRKDKTVSPLSIDHCHKTGKIRGLLCNKCNRGLGYFEDNEVNLIKASDYVSKFREEFNNDSKRKQS